MNTIMPERLVFGSGGSRIMFGVLKNYGYQRDLATGERYLGAFIVPDFQRPIVWTVGQKQRLIESIYMGLPIGSLIVNDCLHHPTDQWLLDGQQRLTAICEWADGTLAVRGQRYPELPEVERQMFRRMTVPVIETSLTTREACLDVYNRLVYGGTPHTEYQRATTSDGLTDSITKGETP